MSEEKNEAATSKKIEDAREKGQVAVSRDLARLISLCAVMELAFFTEPLWREAIEALLILSVSRIGLPFSASLTELSYAAGKLLMLVFASCFLFCSVIGIFSFWGQFGVLIASESITPNFEKLNPMEGIKQLFSKKKLMEVLLSLLKTVLAGLVLYILIRDQLPSIVQLAAGTPKDIYFAFFKLVRSIFHILIGVFLVLALIDFAIQKYFHASSLKMSMEEIKKEYKESEGDPMLKSVRKQLAREWAMENPAAKTAKANALVVNPTHFAVALLFDSTTPVPLVLAKGKDDTAHAMIARAKECGIPVIRHVWLARTLYATCKSDTVVPKSSYEAVAHVYAVVNELHEKSYSTHTHELENYGVAPKALN